MVFLLLSKFGSLPSSLALMAALGALYVSALGRMIPCTSATLRFVKRPRDKPGHGEPERLNNMLKIAQLETTAGSNEQNVPASTLSALSVSGLTTL
jgi:hypothetical protein